MPVELLLILLPVAAASGWLMARRAGMNRKTASSDRVDLASGYFRGINYFLNEQPDKAIDAFVHALEADSSVVEPHLALGGLFRRRGEVDRAIRIHQNLIARPTLSRKQRDQALHELAQDYLQAGLLDRAENLFRELLERDGRNLSALRHLNDIYVQEKEWEDAIAVLQKIESAGGERRGHVIAHYHCERAEQLIHSGDISRAKKMLKRALTRDAGCVRASLLSAQVAERAGNDRQALRFYRKAAEQGDRWLSELLRPWLACVRRTGRQVEMSDPIIKQLAGQPAIQPVIDYVDYLQEAGRAAEARTFLMDFQRARPSLRGLERLMRMDADTMTAGEAGSNADFVQGRITEILGRSALYKCAECGFESNVMHWLCPGCRRWNTVSAGEGP